LLRYPKDQCPPRSCAGNVTNGLPISITSRVVVSPSAGYECLQEQIHNLSVRVDVLLPPTLVTLVHLISYPLSQLGMIQTHSHISLYSLSSPKTQACLPKLWEDICWQWVILMLY
jgi:hypothetical protein